MRTVNIAFGFIQQGNNFLLQLRNGDPKIGGAGLIGCFGGKINEGEDPLTTFCREIFEETGLSLNSSTVRKMGIVRVESDHRLETVKVIGHVFHWELKDDLPEVKEGELVIMTLDDALVNKNKLTAGTRAAFEELL